MIEVYEDIGATVVYSFEQGNAHVDFTAHEIIGHSSNDGRNFDVPLYEGIGGCGIDGKETTDVEKANKYIHGGVKWDGCSHLYFGVEDGYLHVCGSTQMVNLADLLKRIYTRCYEIGGFTYDILVPPTK